jgi:hypothetical protein
MNNGGAAYSCPNGRPNLNPGSRRWQQSAGVPGGRGTGFYRANVVGPAISEPLILLRVISARTQEATMGLGKGALLWLIGIPIPIIILLILFLR